MPFFRVHDAKTAETATSKAMNIHSENSGIVAVGVGVELGDVKVNGLMIQVFGMRVLRTAALIV